VRKINRLSVVLKSFLKPTGFIDCPKVARTLLLAPVFVWFLLLPFLGEIAAGSYGQVAICELPFDPISSDSRGGYGDASLELVHFAVVTC